MRATTTATNCGPLVFVAASLLLAAQLASVGVAARRGKCPAERDLEMDVCASKLGFVGDHSFRVPRNVSGASAFCAQLKDSIGCIQSYAHDCLQGFTRQVLMSLLRRGKQQYSLVCADNRAKQALIDRLQCLGGERIEQLHACMDASVARFEHIGGKAPPDARLPGLCCSYQIFNRELAATMERACGKPASGARAGAASAHEFVRRVVGGTTDEFFQLICDGHRSLDECRASRTTRELLARLEDVTRQVAAGRLRPRNKSLVPVLLDILESASQ